MKIDENWWNWWKSASWDYDEKLDSTTPYNLAYIAHVLFIAYPLTQYNLI